MKVSELISELEKAPQNAHVGFYHSNAYNRGDPMWMSFIQSVEVYDNTRPGHVAGYRLGDEVVCLIGGIG